MQHVHCGMWNRPAVPQARRIVHFLTLATEQATLTIHRTTVRRSGGHAVSSAALGRNPCAAVVDSGMSTVHDASGTTHSGEGYFGQCDPRSAICLEGVTPFETICLHALQFD